jgi:hypothetical protein
VVYVASGSSNPWDCAGKLVDRLAQHEQVGMPAFEKQACL